MDTPHKSSVFQNKMHTHINIHVQSLCFDSTKITGVKMSWKMLITSGTRIQTKYLWITVLWIFLICYPQQRSHCQRYPLQVFWNEKQQWHWIILAKMECWTLIKCNLLWSCVILKVSVPSFGQQETQTPSNDRGRTVDYHGNREMVDVQESHQRSEDSRHSCEHGIQSNAILPADRIFIGNLITYN